MPLAELERELDLADSERLLGFIKRGWAALEPGTEFRTGWAVEAMAEHLEAVSRGEITRLLINVPPGATKSMLVNVFWPAWEWTRNPSLRFISASYAEKLAIRDLVRCRDLIDSEWYQDLWPLAWKSDQNQKTYYENRRRGWRLAAAVRGAITGFRGDRIVVDDPHNVQTAESDKVRDEAIRWFAETLPTRVNDQEKSPIVVIMQRVHERDVSGFILASELGYDHLCLPMRYESDHPALSRTRLGFRDPRTTPGELLWPARFSETAVSALEHQYRAHGGEYAVAGQLQQRPAPRGGGMFQIQDFQYLDQTPTGGQVCRGWDLAASTGATAAWTVGARLRKVDGVYYLEDVVRFRGTPHEVRQRIRATANADGRSVRQSLPQDPGQAGKYQKADLAQMLDGLPIHFSPETGSKEDRAAPLAAQAGAGNLYLVRGAWNAAFLDEACVFPSGQFSDQIDAASRAYGFLLRKTKSLGGLRAPKILPHA